MPPEDALTNSNTIRDGTLRFPWLQCAAETWKGVLHERLKSCLNAAQMMRAGPSGSAFRSGSQTTPSCCVRKTNDNEPVEDASLRNKRRQNQGRVSLLGQVRRGPDDWADGDRRRGGVSRT